MSHLSANLKRLRVSRNLTQEALADRISATKSHISRLESGEAHPSLAMLERLAKALAVDSSTLLSKRRISRAA